MMDETSTGLDSATTFQIVKSVANYCHLLDATVMMSLLQPAPEVPPSPSCISFPASRRGLPTPASSLQGTDASTCSLHMC